MTLFLWLGALGAWLFIVTFVVDGWTRPGYQSSRQPVSAWALGRRGWVQTANFVVCGLAVVVGAVAVADVQDSAVLAMAIGVFGVALVASGVFPMDAMRGYPPGTPDQTPADVSRRHKLHDWAGAVVFLALPVASILATFALPGAVWKAYSALTAAATFAGLLAFGQAWEDDHPRAGLIQRLTIVIGWVWLGLLFSRLAS